MSEHRNLFIADYLLENQTEGGNVITMGQAEDAFGALSAEDLAV